MVWTTMGMPAIFAAIGPSNPALGVWVWTTSNLCRRKSPRKANTVCISSKGAASRSMSTVSTVTSKLLTSSTHLPGAHSATTSCPISCNALIWSRSRKRMDMSAAANMAIFNRGIASLKTKDEGEDGWRSLERRSSTFNAWVVIEPCLEHQDVPQMVFPLASACEVLVPLLADGLAVEDALVLDSLLTQQSFRPVSQWPSQ